MVPIHPRLIKLRFMDYVKAQKKGLLWAELKQSSERHYSVLFAKWWSYYCRSQGTLPLDKEGLWCSIFSPYVAAKEGRVPVDRIKLIVGHADQSITTSTYGGKMLFAQDLVDEFKVKPFCRG